MELSMTLEEVLAAFDAGNALSDVPFADPVTAVKVGQILRALAPLYEDINKKRGALIEKHARRDEDGNIVYTDESKTMVEPTEELLKQINGLLSGETQVTLPLLDAAKLALGEGPNLPPAAIYPLRMALAPQPEHEVKVKRVEVEQAAATIALLANDAFADGSIAARLVLAQGVLIKQANVQNAHRRQLVEEHAERDEDGNIKYVEQARQSIAITPAAAAAIEAYDGEEVTLTVAELRADEFVLASGKGISPRRMYGLMPILTV